MPILRPLAARFHERRISSAMFTSVHLYGNVVQKHVLSHCHVFGSQRIIVVNVVVSAHWPIHPILGFQGAKLPKMGDSLPWTPTHRQAASFILGGKIRNCINKHTQTISDISTPSLSACVDNNISYFHILIYIINIRVS